MRKRQRGSHCIPRKKARVVEVQIAEVVTDNKKLLNKRAAERRIAYHGDKATVALHSKQAVAMDGWATVRVVKGRAAVHGYSLSPGVDFLICSNSKLAAVVTIESISPSNAVASVHSKNHGGSWQSRRTSNKSGNGEDHFGCTLEFQSYRRAIGDCGPRLDDGSPRERSFRLEIGGENKTSLENDSRKRKRDEEMTGDISGTGVEEEEEMSIHEEIEEDDMMNAGSKCLEGEVDMEVDEFSESGGVFLVGPNTKKSHVELCAPLHPTVIPDSWWSAAQSIVQQCDGSHPAKDSTASHTRSNRERGHRAPVVAVCGAKNTGKSTFVRFLLNFLLNSHAAVGYLDTDVEQPEFTVPGCLSLHIVRSPIFGSQVLHLHTPERSFFYGDNSPKVDPEMYSRSVAALYDYFQQKYGHASVSTLESDTSCSTIPLVVNTHGWIKDDIGDFTLNRESGIGSDVVADVLHHTTPTHVVQFTCKTENKDGRFCDSSIHSDQTNMVFIDCVLDGSNRPS